MYERGGVRDNKLRCFRNSVIRAGDDDNADN